MNSNGEPLSSAKLTASGKNAVSSTEKQIAYLANLRSVVYAASYPQTVPTEFF